ncbi:hypothetical protein DSUL_20282 [Desulfovibrionales bacterium]
MGAQCRPAAGCTGETGRVADFDMHDWFQSVVPAYVGNVF